jgi:LysR family hydrogen peroxide-inducible transcriptional activator
MAQVTLRQLRYFEALARHAHFGRAAEASSISQPALSMQIRELEDALGAELVERRNRMIALTPLGEGVAERAREILGAVDELADWTRASHARLLGRLRLGMIPTIAPYLLPTLVARITRSHSEIDIHVREALTHKLLAELEDGRLDAAIVALPVSEPALVEVALFTETFLLVRPMSDEGEPVPSRESLREMRLLLLEEGHCFRDQALSFCKMSNAAPREILDASSLSTLVQMVGAGIGLTLVPEMALAVETRSAEVSMARFRNPQPSRTVGMVWRKRSPLSPLLMQMSAIVLQSAEQVLGRRRRRAKKRPAGS